MIRYLNSKNNTGISVYHAKLDEHIAPGAFYGPYIRDFYIIESCTGGAGAIIINNKEFPIKAGDTYFLLPGDSVAHRSDVISPRRGVYCTVDGVFIKETLEKAGITSESPFVPAKFHKKVTEELYKIYDMRNDKDAGAEYRQAACIHNILGTILSATAVSSDKNLFVKKAIGIMESRYHTEIDIQALADEVGFSRCYFSTAFKNQTNLSPYEYLTNLRIKKACVLLKMENMSVSEVAASVGLDPRNFARLFKKTIGITPYEFIKTEDWENKRLNR